MSSSIRFPTIVAAFAVAAIVFAGIAASSANAAGSVIKGHSSNRNGTTSVRIGGGTATITVSKKVGATSKKRAFQLSCRTSSGDYESVVAILPLSNQRRLTAPAPAPDGKVVRCRVNRDNKPLATMSVKRY